MRERIQKIIDAEGITAAEFADMIGVQRSNVSHVLNGRNNPGFSFIQKVLETFPKVDSRWLLTGEGELFNKDNNTAPVKKAMPDLFTSIEPEKKEQAETIPKQNVNKSTLPGNETVDNTPDNKQNSPMPKKVARVLIFYDDHTFDDYRPAQ
ncbi:MAG: helix-turn-helix transcriptional regulator [Prolixibacteraceae bacterium]|nr:helix-turn-helix transcriptional regulator [Prolixibacteraceae bacterium]